MTWDERYHDRSWHLIGIKEQSLLLFGICLGYEFVLCMVSVILRVAGDRSGRVETGRL
jgi:hypothetical protein